MAEARILQRFGATHRARRHRTSLGQSVNTFNSPVVCAAGNTATPRLMIGKLRSVVLDTKDPAGLAKFYGGVLGGTVEARGRDVVGGDRPQGTRFACQLSPEHEPPRFPDPRGSQQFHLDIEVDDIDAPSATSWRWAPRGWPTPTMKTDSGCSAIQRAIRSAWCGASRPRTSDRFMTEPDGVE